MKELNKLNHSLPEKSLPQVISPYMQALIAQTGGEDGPIGRQFIAQPDLELKDQETKKNDPQMEHLHESAPGVVYKYKGKITESGEVEYFGRALWTISRYCATYCRFCFRGRMVGMPANLKGESHETLSQKPYLADEDIHEVINFLQQHKEINEVILSGGDPLITPTPYLTKIVTSLIQLQNNHDLDIIRIHTRAPITNPHAIREWHYDLIKQIKNPYIVLHVNHPEELTSEVLEVTERFRKECNAILLSQSVLLKGVNNNLSTLQTLFNKLAINGIHPYYLHYNDPVYWAQHFTVPKEEAIKLWQELRPRLSGIAACAKFVIDTPYGEGKVPLPDYGWELNTSQFKDFKGNYHTLD